MRSLWFVPATAMALSLLPPAHAGRSLAAADDPRPNLLVVTFDATRADRIGAYGYPSKTPNIDRLAREGVRMARAYTPSTQTLPSHTSIFTGLYSITHGVVSNGQMLDPKVYTLAEELKQRGYATGAIIGAATLISDFRLNQGFDTYDEEFGGTWMEQSFKSLVRWMSRAKLNIPSTRPAQDVAARAITWLGSHAHRRKPFFLWLHFWDPHEPYDRHPSFDRPWVVDSSGVENQYGQKEANYVNEIEFADHYLGRVLDRLDRLGIARNTLVVFTADHGESLGEHGYQGHRREVWDDVLHVPMIFRFPNKLPAGKVIDAPVMSIDVMPTVLSLLGAKYSPRDYHGSDIFTLGTTPRKVFALAVELFTKTPIRRAVIDGRLKFVQSDESGQGALYDLESDPDELHNLLPMPDHRADASRLRQEIGIWYETFDNLTADSPQLTPAQLERLKSLGYIRK